MELKGSLYGPSDQFNEFIRGLLKALLTNPASAQSVNYIQSLQNFLGESWHTNSAPGFGSFLYQISSNTAECANDVAGRLKVVYLATIVRCMAFLLGSNFHHRLLRCRRGSGSVADRNVQSLRRYKFSHRCCRGGQTWLTFIEASCSYCRLSHLPAAFSFQWAYIRRWCVYVVFCT